jgi:hypothetical protein
MTAGRDYQTLIRRPTCLPKAVYDVGLTLRAVRGGVVSTRPSRFPQSDAPVMQRHAAVPYPFDKAIIRLLTLSSDFR